MASPSLPASSERSSSARAEPDRDGSVSARRSRGSARSSPATDRISSAIVARCAAVASAVVRGELLRRLGVRLAADGGRHQRRPPGGVQLVDEPVDRAPAAGLVGERLTDDPAGQVDGQRAHLGAQVANDALALRGELVAPGGDDPVGLLPRLGEDVLTDALRVGPGLVPDAGRLGAGLGELRAVLLEQLVRLGLRVLGALDAALDRVDPGAERLLHAREDELHQDVADAERRRSIPSTSSCQSGMIGLCSTSASAAKIVVAWHLPAGRGLTEGAGPDEAEGDAQQGEHLDHGEADPEERLGDAGRLRLTSGRLDVGGEDQADTDAGADRREAVTDGGGATHYFGENHFFDSSWYLA